MQPGLAVSEYVEALLRSPDPDERWRAATFLRRAPDEAIDALVRALEDHGVYEIEAGDGAPPYVYVVSEAARESLENAGARAIEPLLSALPAAGAGAAAHIVTLLGKAAAKASPDARARIVGALAQQLASAPAAAARALRDASATDEELAPFHDVVAAFVRAQSAQIEAQVADAAYTLAALPARAAAAELARLLLDGKGGLARFSLGHAVASRAAELDDATLARVIALMSKRPDLELAYLVCACGARAGAAEPALRVLLAKIAPNPPPGVVAVLGAFQVLGVAPPADAMAVLACTREGRRHVR